MPECEMPYSEDSFSFIFANKSERVEDLSSKGSVAIPGFVLLNSPYGFIEYFRLSLSAGVEFTFARGGGICSRFDIVINSSNLLEYTIFAPIPATKTNTIKASNQGGII